MMHPLPIAETPDLAALEAFLASEDSPPDCMHLSELDGFLAGIIVGPEAILPSEWLPHLWRTDGPVFADMQQMSAILGAIMSRNNEIARGLDTTPPSYQPVLARRADDTVDASDWTLGFLLAMSLRQDAWQPLGLDPDGALMLGPIMLIASTSEKADLELDDEDRLPDAEMAKLLADPGPLLAMCVTGMRAYFRAHQRLGRPTRRRGKPGRSGKSRK